MQKLQKTIKVTANDEKFEIQVEMDFTDVANDDLLKWAFADRIIAMQRVLRECSFNTLRDFEENGYNVHANAAGQKPQTTAELIAQLKKTLAGADPAKRDEILAGLM